MCVLSVWTYTVRKPVYIYTALWQKVDTTCICVNKKITLENEENIPATPGV